MGLFNKLMFWKKDDLAMLDDPGFGSGFGKNPGMDMGGYGGMNNGMNLGKDMPDVTNYRGVGNLQSTKEMNQSLYQQLGEDPLDMPNAFNSTPSDGYSSYGKRAAYQQQQPMQQQMAMQSSSRTEYEILSAKLDAIKATMDAINQRLASIERVAYQEQDKKRNNW